MQRSLSLSLLAGALALVLLAGCGGEDGDATAAPGQPAAAASDARQVRVETLTLEPSAFADVIEITGTVEATNDATLSAQSAGTVLSLKPLGARVGPGETIAQLDPGIAQANVAQAEAAVEAAQAQADLAADNLARQEPLYRDSVISAIEFENVRAQASAARADLARAKAALAQAREGLRNTRVVSPFAGVVEARLVEPGEQVSPGAPVARVVNVGTVKVNAGVPERYASDIEVGTPVEVALSAYDAAPRTARVTFVGSAIDAGSRTFPVEIALSNPDGNLKPEMVARVFLTREALEDALVVPRTAVLRDETGAAVYVVTRRSGEPVAERRDVVLGAEYGDLAVVTSGLDAGDEIIIRGQNNVTSGDAVEVVEQHAALAVR